MEAAELRAWRMRHNLTQQKMADLLGLSVSRLADYEAGKSRSQGRSGAIPPMVDLALAELERRLDHEYRAAARKLHR